MTVVRDNEETRQATCHMTMDGCCHPIDYDGYSFALVANGGLIESPRLPLPTRIAGRGPASQQRLRNGCPTGTIKSTPLFDCASGSYVSNQNYHFDQSNSSKSKNL